MVRLFIGIIVGVGRILWLLLFRLLFFVLIAIFVLVFSIIFFLAEKNIRLIFQIGDAFQ